MRNLTLALCLFASTATAQDLIVQFTDGAPKDRITLTNGGCTLSNAMVLLNLKGSQGGLVFDTSSGGAGVEVFQPVEITSGYAALSPVKDGDEKLQIFVQSLMEGGTLGLTADLDDTSGGAGEITVTGSEMAGASVQIALNDRVITGTFDTSGQAKLPLPSDASVCLAAIN